MASRALNRQVQHDLLELVLVSDRDERAAGQVDTQLDVLAQRAIEHRRHSANDLVHVQRLRIGDVSPSERQQLPCEPRRSLRRGPDLPEIRRGRCVGHPLSDQRGVVEDHAQQVVEVVGDAYRELAEALQPPRLFAPRGDVQAGLLLSLPR
jgi:hypothetical protein